MTSFKTTVSVLISINIPTINLWIRFYATCTECIQIGSYSIAMLTREQVNIKRYLWHNVWKFKLRRMKVNVIDVNHTTKTVCTYRAVDYHASTWYWYILKQGYCDWSIARTECDKTRLGISGIGSGDSLKWDCFKYQCQIID